MNGTHADIRWASPTDARITLDGHPLDEVTHATIEIGRDHFPRLFLELDVADVSSVVQDAELHIGQQTRELLERAGWTPPAADGAAAPAVKLDRETLPHLVELFVYLGWTSPEQNRRMAADNVRYRDAIGNLERAVERHVAEVRERGRIMNSLLDERNALQAKLDELAEPVNAAAATPEPAEPINIDNDQLVGVQGSRWITALLPSRGMTPDAALRHAAWLVAMADVCKPGLADRFPVVLRAVRNT